MAQSIQTLNNLSPSQKLPTRSFHPYNIDFLVHFHINVNTVEYSIFPVFQIITVISFSHTCRTYPGRFYHQRAVHSLPVLCLSRKIGREGHSCCFTTGTIEPVCCWQQFRHQHCFVSLMTSQLLF